MTQSAPTRQDFTHKSHILVIDDDARICKLVSRYLQENGFIALSANSAEEAFEILKRFSFDALVVDVMMPGQSGLEFTAELRSRGETIPVLILTALGESSDRIGGLESGADDYLPKPFEPRELVLRLKAILRRTQKPSESVKSIYKIGNWRFDPEHDELIDGQKVSRLTAVEGNLLRALLRKAGQVVSREELATDCGLESAERTIDVQVTRLRRKIETDPKTPRWLQTVRGKGYLLRAEKVKP
ncbi:MAG: response regulator transcription factor [Alphaproteobacteria bacterium]|nr:response regulator transcription factor [Alphaproteobacteria bacterium]